MPPFLLMSAVREGRGHGGLCWIKAGFVDRGRGVARTDGQTRAETTQGAPDATPAKSGVSLLSGGTTAQAMSASPPVDTDRVATIRKAISEGRFPCRPRPSPTGSSH
ncbi:flagellar biosynthesis anti-sigma factor FlgM [Sphingomonas panni]